MWALSHRVHLKAFRSTVLMTGVAKNTVAKLLVEIGAACSEYQDQVMRNLPVRAGPV